MSFSSEVRKELCGYTHPARHCALAELSAMINTACSVSPDEILFSSEHSDVAQKYGAFLYKLFQIQGDARHLGHTHSITVTGRTPVGRILKATGCIINAHGVEKDVNPLVVMDQCCKRAYTRGSFITGGTLSNPEKTYHFEFSLPSPPTGQLLAQRLCVILRSFGLHPKTTVRKSHVIVYIKEAENIVDLLNIMEAHKSLLKLENVRIVKEVRNSVNRKVNFETANLNKTVEAAVSQIKDIEYIAATVGFGYLSEGLEDVARLRLEYNEASLKEIGEMLTPPVGKSGVNHRLRKISEIAEELRCER